MVLSCVDKLLLFTCITNSMTNTMFNLYFNKYVTIYESHLKDYFIWFILACLCALTFPNLPYVPVCVIKSNISGFFIQHPNFFAVSLTLKWNQLHTCTERCLSGLKTHAHHFWRIKTALPTSIQSVAVLKYWMTVIVKHWLRSSPQWWTSFSTGSVQAFVVCWYV